MRPHRPSDRPRSPRRHRTIQLQAGDHTITAADPRTRRQVADSDAFAGSLERDTLLAQDQDMPTADELAAQFERFLAEQDGPSDQ